MIKYDDLSRDDKAEIIEKTRELEEKYPVEANYNSRASLWGCGANNGLVSDELYNKAVAYYGRLWTYVGD